MAAISNTQRPAFPVEYVTEPHIGRKKGARLAPFSSKIWASEIPFWMMDARVIKLLVDACATSIEKEMIAASSTVYPYIVFYEKQSALTANSIDQANIADASLQRLLLGQFPEIYLSLSPDQIRTAIGLSEGHAVVDLLLKHAAVSQIVAWVHATVSMLEENSISTFPLAYLKKDHLDGIDWDAIIPGAAPGGVYTLNELPATPARRAEVSAQASTIAELQAKLTAAEARIPPQDAQEDLWNNAAHDRAVAARLLATPARDDEGPAPQRRRLNTDGEFGHGGRPVLPIDRSTRAALLAPPRAAHRARQRQERTLRSSPG